MWYSCFREPYLLYAVLLMSMFSSLCFVRPDLCCVFQKALFVPHSECFIRGPFHFTQWNSFFQSAPLFRNSSSEKPCFGWVVFIVALPPQETDGTLKSSKEIPGIRVSKSFIRYLKSWATILLPVKPTCRIHVHHAGCSVLAHLSLERYHHYMFL